MSVRLLCVFILPFLLLMTACQTPGDRAALRAERVASYESIDVRLQRQLGELNGQLANAPTEMKMEITKDRDECEKHLFETQRRVSAEAKTWRETERNQARNEARKFSRNNRNQIEVRIPDLWNEDDEDKDLSASRAAELEASYHARQERIHARGIDSTPVQTPTKRRR